MTQAFGVFDVSDHDTNADERSVPQNFIRTIIDEDLASGKHQQIVTRFPPEPYGYLHIGHAKSICLNFRLAQDYKGRCHLRFDDTNPLKESTEYVESIKRDVAWLGFDWGEHLYFASDYFEQMYDFAVDLIKQGLAYVDSQTLEEIREGRGELGKPGTPSPYRDRSVEENMELFAKMRAGEFADGEHVLRAKIDMSNPNMLMRDPVLYRIRHAHHHNTGDAWCLYPMYDFAHCLEDAIEEITHSLCTLEFENNREVYDWILDHVELPGTRPRQYEFARLNLEHTIMSKRKLLQLVEEGHVDGWDDPRMPTISGLRRRGVTPEAIRSFAEMIGVAKANSTVDIAQFEYAIRDDLNHKAPRVMGVLDPLKVVVTNWPEDKVDWLEADHWPEDIPKEASREVPFTRELYIEREDFMEDPSKKFYRLAPGREVRLRYGYFITCEEVVKDADGEVVELRCTHDPESRGGSTPDNRRVKGTIHWVSATESVKATLRLYDRLFSVPNPGGSEEWLKHLNPQSLEVVEAHVEPYLKEVGGGAHFQFERQGYFFTDPEDHTAGDDLVFNQVVPLKDSWAKIKAKQHEDDGKGEEHAPAPDETPKGTVPKKAPEEARNELRAANPRLAGAYERFQSEYELSKADADILTGDEELVDFFEEAVAAHPDSPQSVANWVVNELLREIKDTPLDDLPLTASDVGALARLFDEGTISSRAAKDVFGIMLEEGGDPEAIVEEKGLTQISDPDKIAEIIDEVIEANTEQVEQYRDGKTNLLGYFIGQVMKASRGKADPEKTRAILQEKL